MIQSRRERLGASLLVLLAGLATPALGQQGNDELKAIDSELTLETKNLRETLKDKGSEESQAIYDEYTNTVLPEFAERYAAVGRAHPGDDVALEAWKKVIGLATRGMRHETTGEALRALARDHLQSTELAEVAVNLRYSVPRIEEADVLATLRGFSASPNREVQAAALYNLGAVLGNDRAAGDPRLEEAKAVLGKLAAYGDVEMQKGTSYAKAATTFLFALENLVVGKACPDFAAVDAEGAGFNLSDYKGKVVLVDFWGFW